MKVLLVPSWYPTEHNPISGIFFKEQAEAIHNNGCDVTVLAINIIGVKDLINNFKILKLFKICEKNINGVKTFSINIFGFGITRTKLFYKLYCLILNKVYNKLKDRIGSIDVVHAHSFKYAGYGCTKVFNKLPVVVTEHSTAIVNNQLKKYDINYLVYTIKNSQSFICVSSFLKNKVIDITNITDNIVVIPNIVSSVFKYNNNNNNGDFIFCSVSNLIYRKRVKLLIEAFYKSFRNHKNVYLKIAGDGDERELLSNVINELGLQDRVCLLGQLDRDHIVKLYNNSNAFIMVSASETFGVVYAESLMCGLPTIGTHNGGAEDILNCYGGYLCKVDDINNIAYTMVYLYNNYSTIDRNRIQAETYDKFSAYKVADKIIDLYKEVSE